MTMTRACHPSSVDGSQNMAIQPHVQHRSILTGAWATVQREILMLPLKMSSEGHMVGWSASGATDCFANGDICVALGTDNSRYAIGLTDQSE